jgi:3-hydroxyisobutyrate dehydrogenase
VVASGAEAPGSISALASKSDVLCVMVVDDAQVEAVLVGPEGAMAAAPRGAVIAVHSTIKPATARRLAQRAADQGLGLIDAPVSGAEPAAIAGTLTFMLGGGAAAVDRCRPAFEAMGRQIFHMGDVGAGLTAKIVNNMVAIVNVRSALEGFRLAKAAGLDQELITQVMGASTGRGWAVDSWQAMEDVIDRSGDGGAGLAHLRDKDLRLALALGKELGVDLPVTAFTAETMDWHYPRKP